MISDFPLQIVDILIPSNGQKSSILNNFVGFNNPLGKGLKEETGTTMRT